MNDFLRVNDLHIRYRTIEAVKGVTFSISAGDRLCILGSNGAGKSSIVRALAGMVRPTRGRVMFGTGLTDITSWPAWKRAREGFAIVPEGGRVFRDLTVRENIQLGAYSRRGLPSEQRIRETAAVFPAMAERLDERAGSLSGGQQQMVAIARALVSQPQVLIVDEVTSGLAPILVDEVFAALRELPDRYGLTLVVVEQNAVRALAISERAIILDRGVVVADESAETFRNSSTLLDAYLGAAQ